MLGLQKRYYKSILVKVFQRYKFAVKKNSRPFGFEATFYVVVHGRILAKIQKFKTDKLWAPTTPQPLDHNESLVPVLKALIYICLGKNYPRQWHHF